jgi:hypothetical protein
MSSYKYRAFPLPTTPSSGSVLDKPKDDDDILGQSGEAASRPKTCPASVLEKDEQLASSEIDYEALIDESAQQLLTNSYPIIPNPPKTVEELIKLKLRRLCPELYYMDKSSLSKCDPPNSNISVRHVQPMAPGKHVVCKNILIPETEPLLKRSAATFRKTMFDQTARMFQSNQKGTLVYDVMDYTVAQSIKPEDNTLLFDSRFESGNLQMAVKVSTYEYDLLLETDINSSPGRHNQVFIFKLIKSGSFSLSEIWFLIPLIDLMF